MSWTLAGRVNVVEPILDFAPPIEVTTFSKSLYLQRYQWVGVPLTDIPGNEPLMYSIVLEVPPWMVSLTVQIWGLE